MRAAGPDIVEIPSLALRRGRTRVFIDALRRTPGLPWRPWLGTESSASAHSPHSPERARSCSRRCSSPSAATRSQADLRVVAGSALWNSDRLLDLIGALPDGRGAHRRRADVRRAAGTGLGPGRAALPRAHGRARRGRGPRRGEPEGDRRLVGRGDARRQAVLRRRLRRRDQLDRRALLRRVHGAGPLPRDARGGDPDRRRLRALDRLGGRRQRRARALRKPAPARVRLRLRRGADRLRALPGRPRRPRRRAVATGRAPAFGREPSRGGRYGPGRDARRRARGADAGRVRGPARRAAGAVGRVAVAQGAGRLEDPGRAAGSGGSAGRADGGALAGAGPCADGEPALGGAQHPSHRPRSGPCAASRC